MKMLRRAVVLERISFNWCICDMFYRFPSSIGKHCVSLEAASRNPLYEHMLVSMFFSEPQWERDMPRFQQ